MRVISKKRFLSTTIGVILATAIIFSSFTLGNNESKVEIFNTLEKMNYHFRLYCSLDGKNLENVLKKIDDISHVKRIIGDAEVSLFNDTLVMDLIYLINMSFPSIGEGRYPQKLNEIAISPEYAELNNFSVGDEISFGAPFNITFHVVGILSNMIEISYENPDFYEAKTSFSLVLTTLDTVAQFSDVRLSLGIKIDPQYLISSMDMKEVRKKLQGVEADAQDIMVEYGGKDIRIFDTIGDFFFNSFSAVSSLIFALPVIVMGAYLSKVGIEIELFERRREFGILRIRGATNLQRFKLLLIEGFVYGILGGIIGYLLGELIAYLSNDSLFHLPFFVLDWGFQYFIISIAISISLFFIALYKPWKKIATTPLIELISHYSEKFKNPEYNATKDIVTVGVMWTYLIIGIYLLNHYSNTYGLTLIAILLGIILVTLMFMFPIILIYLPLGTTRLITLGFPKVYEIIAGGVSKFMRTSGDIVKKSVRRNPKNVAHLAFILAFLLTLSTFISVTVDSQEKFTEVSEVAFVGGDFNVGEKINLTLLQSSPNVSSFAPYSLNEGWYYSSMINIMTVNFENFSATVYPLKYLIKEGSLKSDEVAISDHFAREYDLHVGDKILVTLTSHNGMEEKTERREYRIGCIMYVIPSTFYMDNVIMVNGNVNQSEMSGVFVRAKDYDVLKEELNSYGVFYEERKEEEQHGIKEFTTLLLLYLIILGASSIFIIQYSLYLNRRGEMALYRVRGARRGQGVAILMAEGTTVIILSLIIGIVIGSVLAYFVSVLESSSISLPPIFVMGKYFAIVTALLAGIFLLSQYILSLKFASVDINEVIREIGGEM